eukprot:CAMPEP_0113909616 /NCGR_PEP_ID=MMETSP0780_2-20120614/26977_1 /TAXON_ID=652834 /ORGANISM="Palpitomonas bilix" /LENGTH=477 /DNA_ID=CAMNT_0000905497 /DNA_START=84 /DNA_END=1517 /DNA_ORIENTATION=+ /assembly_acc=CAM_ASM_000599
MAMDMYFPKLYVNQAELEKFDGVSEGKYTIGLGQENMAVSEEIEDINSIALTVTKQLMEKYGISARDIGRLEVGTETLVDKSKAVKTVLMDLFKDSGNTDIEGVDTSNACYGGTQALFNAVDWVESSSWDGRYALVIAGDIAVYEKGPARPTGGSGIVAMLVGPNAALPLERGTRSHHMEHVYDFYKPAMNSEYPKVDGKLSIVCYFRALDYCYRRYMERFEKLHGGKCDRHLFDYTIFHSPYNKLVQRAYSRLYYNDFLKYPEDETLTSLKEFAHITDDESYVQRDFLNAVHALTRRSYNEKCVPGTMISREIGNMYTGSLYGGILSLLTERDQAALEDKRVMCFSYGSGLAASLFSIKVNSSDAEVKVDDIRRISDIKNRLAAREKLTPEEFTDVLTAREMHYASSNREPQGNFNKLWPGTYYVKSVDDMERRHYARHYHTATAAAAVRSAQSSVKAMRAAGAARVFGRLSRFIH